MAMKEWVLRQRAQRDGGVESEPPRRHTAYETRPVAVDAVQYGGTRAHVSAIRRWYQTGRYDPPGKDPRETGKPLKLTGSNGKITVQPGEWIVKWEDGHTEVMDTMAFLETFQAAEGTVQADPWRDVTVGPPISPDSWLMADEYADWRIAYEAFRLGESGGAMRGVSPEAAWYIWAAISLPEPFPGDELAEPLPAERPEPR